MVTTLAGLPVFNSSIPGEIPPMEISAYSVLTVPAYWRAIRFLAENLASFPRSVHRDGAKDEAGHPLDQIIKRRPNGYQNPTQFWRTWFYSAAHEGNGYAEIGRSETGAPAALHNLCCADVMPFRYDAGDGTGPQQFYLIAQPKKERRIVAGADILHIMGLSHDGMIGINPCVLFAETYTRASTLEKFTTKYLSKGTFIRGSIEIPAQATKEKEAEVLSTITTHFSGSNASRDMLILSGGATLKNATINPQQGQIIEQGAMSTKAIAQITSVPPQFLYEFSESKYNNSIEQMGQDVVRYTFRPWIEQTEDELTAKLCSVVEQETGYTIRINPDALLRGDTAAVTSAVVAQVNAGLRNPNEGRALLDLPPDSDPASDKLKTLGDTTPQANRPSPAPIKAAAQRDAEAFAQLKPIIDATAARVDAKTAKAFENHGEKVGQARTIHFNVFAEQQKTYAAAALTALSQTFEAMGGQALPVDQIAEKYAQAIRQRAATGQAFTLDQLITASRSAHVDPE